MKSINNLKPKEYLEGHRLTLANAFRHRETGKFLQKNNLLPSAFTSYVFAAEEVAKSVALYYVSKVGNFATMDKFFTDHIVKHGFIFDFLFADFSEAEVLAIVESPEEIQLNKNKGMLIAIVIAVILFSLKEEHTDFFKGFTKEKLKRYLENLRLKSQYVDYDIMPTPNFKPSELILSLNI